jgi:cell division inhibitor SulA
MALRLRVARAEEMLKAFASIGATVFDLTCTDIDEKKAVFRKSRPFPTLTAQVPVILQTADSRQWNVIVRPHAGQGRVLVQLDDLDRPKVERVRNLSFLVIETSPESFQAWLAVEATTQAETLIRAVRRGAAADTHASGATRIAGSKNFKAKYSPDFPTVALFDLAHGRTVTEQDLEREGLMVKEELSAPRPYAPQRAKRARDFLKSKVPPSYSRCLEDAPAARNHMGKDRSAADFEFCLICADRGYSPEETADLLMDVSEKSKVEGRRYAEFTAKRADAIVRSRRGDPENYRRL